MSSTNYQFNDHNVCINPEIVYHFMPPNSLAWAYVDIEICEKEGLFSFGYSSLGGGSPCGVTFTIHTKEEAILMAIEYVEKCLTSDSGMIRDKSKYLHNFNQWKISRKQLQLF